MKTATGFHKSISKRMLAALLALCMVIGMVPMMAQASPTFSAALPARLVEQDSTAKIEVTPIGSYTFESSDESIATVDSNGVVTGVAMGIVDITVNGTGGSATVSVPVTGKNLLIRDDKNNGTFEAGINNPASMWTANLTAGYEVLTDSALSRDGSDILKTSFDAATKWRSQMQIIANATYATQAYLATDASKLYEYSGFVKLEDVVSGRNPKMEAEIYFFNSTTNPNGTLVASQQINSSTKIGHDVVGTSDWLFFQTPTSATLDAAVIGANPRFKSAVGSANTMSGNVYQANLSYHEVIYQKLDLSYTGSTTMVAGDGTLQLSAKHLTNTGTQILPGKTSAGAAVPIEVTYTSDADSVASVDSAGLIAAKSAGNANITATATIGGVTRSSTVAVTVTAPPVNAALQTVTVGTANADVIVKVQNQITVALKDVNDAEIRNQDATLTYSIEPASAAEISADGTLVAKVAGPATLKVAATVGGVTKEGTLPITIVTSGTNKIVNADFETDPATAFPWDVTLNGTGWRTFSIAQKERAGNAANKAFKINLDPATAVSAQSAFTFKAGQRIPIEFGKFYELSLWVKIEGYTLPPDAAGNVVVSFDTYAYDAPSGGALTGVSYRAKELHKDANFPSNYAEWTKITLDVFAPFEKTTTSTNPGAYITPRFSITPNAGDVGMTDIGGVIWIDDVELREVGFDKVIMTHEGDTSAPDAVSTLTLNALTTTGAKMGVLAAKLADAVKLTSSKPTVATVSNLRNASGNLAPMIADITTKANGTTDITAEVTLNGETRSAIFPLTISGLANTLASVALTVPTDPIALGTAASASVAGLMSDGGAADLKNATIAYTSATPGVVTVNPTTGALTPVAEGSSEISVSVTLDSRTITDTKTVSVVDNSGLASVTLTSPENTVGVRRTVQLALSGSMVSGNPAYLPNATISYTKLSGDGDVTISDTGLVTGVAAGAVTIQASVTLRGVTKTATVALTVNQTMENTLTYDFTALGTGGIDLRNATFAQTGDTWAMDSWEPAITDGAAADLLPKLIRSQPYGMQVQSKGVGQWVTVRIKVNEAGYYTPSVSVGGASGGCNIRVYVAPAVTPAADRMLNQYSIGKINCYSATYVQNFSTVKMRSLLFPTAGEYVVTFKADSSGGGSSYNMYPGKVVLERIGFEDDDPNVVLPSADISKMKPTRNLLLTEKMSIPASVTMADGSYEDLTSATITAISSDPSKIATSISDKNEVVLEGKALATDVNITISVKLGAKTNTISFPLSVVEPGTDAPPDTVFNFRENQTGTPFTATIAANGWKMNQDKTASGSVRYQSYGISVPCSVMNTPVDSDANFTVNIPFDGNYTVKYDGGKFGGGAISAIYVDGKYVGQYDHYSATSTVVGETVQMLSLNLTKGEHEVLFRAIGKTDGSWGYYHYIGRIAFVGIKTLPTIGTLTAEAGKTDLAAGETTSINASFSMSDGTIVTPAKNLDGSSVATVSYTSSDSQKLTVDANGNVIALAAGDVDVTVKITMGSTEKTTIVPFTINGNTFESFDVTLTPETLFVDASSTLSVVAKFSDGTVIAPKDYSVTYSLEEADGIMSLANNVLTGIGPGTANVVVTVKFSIFEKTKKVPVTVSPIGLARLELSASSTFIKPDGTTQITIKPYANSGNLMNLADASISYQSLTPAFASVDANGVVTGIASGLAVIEATVTIDGITQKAELNITVRGGKVSSTIYTPEKVAAARENVKLYPWAKTIADTATAKADEYVEMADKLWELVPQEGLPRGITVGYQNEAGAYTCPYCETDLRKEFGVYPWISDPLNHPWKIQCPKCRNRFPSNDFENFYKSGLDEKGVFHYDLAKQNGQQFLVNTMYPEKGEGWGVDDGYGYVMPNGEHKAFISYYNHWGLWYPNGTVNPGLFYTAVNNLRDAYLYTGDPKYGRVGAILIDRIADVYPAYDLLPYFGTFYNSHGGSGEGKIIGRIWETGLATAWARGYDAFFDMYDDPYVVDFLAKKSAKYGLENPKTTPAMIRQNCEDGLLRTIFTGVKKAQIYGNFGMHQESLIAAAVALDNMPDTKTMLDFTMQSGSYSKSKVTGGNVMAQVVDLVNRDGTGNESGPGYNNLWINSLLIFSEMLRDYPGYTDADLYQNPKFTKMFAAMVPLTLTSRYTVQIGDSGATGGIGIAISKDSTLVGYKRFGSDLLAQTLYMLNGDSVKDLHYDIFTKDPESVQDSVKNVINEKGLIKLDSQNLTGYGFAVLRDGVYAPALVSSDTVDNQRDFWINYGRNAGHGHPDALNLGMDAYGLNLAPDLGYPEATGADVNRAQWINNTLSHNTVVVNETKQNNLNASANIQHFDDSGRVKIMDVDAPAAYNATSIYRRTVVMVEASNDVSYGIDFFRIKGGNDHLYTFHTTASEDGVTENLNMVKQWGTLSDGTEGYIGSYAGPNVAWGNDTANYPLGYTWLENVRKDTTLTDLRTNGSFSVDFKIKDGRNVLKTPRDLHLRLTMLNSNLNEVSLTKGTPPRVKGNDVMGKLEYLLARRKGTNLDTTFTTVLEPYDGTRYITNIKEIPLMTVAAAQSAGKKDAAIITLTNGTAGANDMVRALQVSLAGGREDYIIYASNNALTYTITKFDSEGAPSKLLDFRGFVGVTSMVDGTQIYTYLNDGDQMGDLSGTAACTGTVTTFTKELSFQNSITIKPTEAVDLAKLAGKFIYVTNDGVESGSYEIKGATAGANGTVVLDIGDVSPIRKYKSASDINAGYVYNIGEGQTFRIPLPTVADDSPIFDPIPDQIANAGSPLTVSLNASSPTNKTLTYSAGSVPRGANVSNATKSFTWTPDSSQIGKHSVAIVVSDGTFTTTTYFKVTVYPQTGGGGGGGGGGSEESKPISLGSNVYQDTKTGKIFCAGPDQQPNTADDLTNVVKGADGKYYLKNADGTYLAAGNDGLLGTTDDLRYKPGVDNKIGTKDDELIEEPKPIEEKFTDLTDYDWAKDSINRLTEKGIIKGTSETTFSPGRDISRADFAILVVRALGLTSDATGAFTDVNSSDYFYNEVRIAQALGIVQGSGGMFRPGDSITREDMMVMLARGLELTKGASEDLANFSDTNAISDYAVEAVATLVKSGLITGSNGKINPKGNATRAEVAVLLDRLLQKQESAKA